MTAADPSYQIRDATEADLAEITRIYNWTIIDNHVSFDTEPYDVARRQAWWDGRDPELRCLVADTGDGLAGVTYSSWYRPKQAYRSSMETTIVLDLDHRGHGLGTLLLGSLCDRLRDQGVHRAIAIVALPNDASIALHHKLGYTTVGTLTDVGFKLGRHWDTTILEKQLTSSARRSYRPNVEATT